MREVIVGPIDWGACEGWGVSIPVVVDWPELQLSDEESWENAMALAGGLDPPHPNHAFFTVTVRR